MRRHSRHLAAQPAAYIRHALAGCGSRLEGRSGAFRARIGVDDADLHAHQRGATQRGVPQSAPEGMKVALVLTDATRNAATRARWAVGADRPRARVRCLGA